MIIKILRIQETIANPRSFVCYTNYKLSSSVPKEMYGEEFGEEFGEYGY